MNVNSKPQIITIFFLTFAIISSSYGIISLLQHKGNKVNMEETVYYQKCSSYLKGQDLGYCDIFKG